MRVGQLLAGRYRLDDRVDAGGMGTVWRGTDTRLHRTVAIKVLHAGLSNDEVFRRRFEVEARAVAALQAPGIVNIYDYGEDPSPEGSVCYLIMEFVDGRSLASILAEHGRIERGELLRILAEAADALDAAHRAGIIHRDVKPGNILITRRDGKPKLVDFGIARAHGEAGLTSTGMIMGTAAYVSPEQLHGHQLTGASDVYSLGVVAYECLAGRKPFTGDTPAGIIAGHISHQPPQLPPDVPPVLVSLVMRTLAKNPADRWPSAAAFAQACRDAAEGRSAAPTTAVMNAPPPMGATSVMPGAPVSPPRGVAGVARPPAPQTRQHTQQHRSPTPDPEPKKSNLATVGVIAAVVVLAMVGLLIWQPWLPADDAADADQTQQSQGTEQEQDPDDSTVEEDGNEQQPPPDTETEPESDPEPSTEQPPATGEIPSVIGDEYYDAYAELSEAGFNNIVVTEDGEGGYRCKVIGQDFIGPGYSFDTTVSLTVQMTATEDDC